MQRRPPSGPRTAAGPRSSRRANRRRLRRSRRGQVAAIATLFGLMLVVLMISEFSILPLPAQEQSAELAHDVAVENQVGGLQSAVAAQVAHPSLRVTLTSPISLGSTPIPPFGPSSPSQLTFAPQASGATLALASGSFVPAIAPNANLCNAFFPIPTPDKGGYLCTATSNNCGASTSGNLWTNFSTLVFALLGSQGCTYYLNVTGSSNTIDIYTTANGAGLNVIIDGSGNKIKFGAEGTVAGGALFNIYGSSNTFGFDSNFTKTSQTVNVNFVGEQSSIGSCPVNDLSYTTDSLGTITGAPSSTILNVVYENDVGISTPLTKDAGPPTPPVVLYFGNTSLSPSPANCAFGVSPQITTTSIAGEGGGFSGTVAVALQNTFSSAETVAFEDGAVITSALGSPAPEMLDPPPFEFQPTPAGIVANLTLYELIGPPASTQSGYDTASVSTTLITEVVVAGSLPLGGSGAQGTPEIVLVTAYPSVWMSYFNTLPSGEVSTPSCSSSATIRAPYSCTSPPPGLSVTLSVPLTTYGIYVTLAVLQVGVA